MIPKRTKGTMEMSIVKQAGSGNKRINVEEIKRIVAREGLVILALAIVLYLIVGACAHISIPLLKYRLDFENGQNYVIVISPELSQGYNKKKFIRDTLDPSPRLVSKRIGEFIRDNRIKAGLKEARPLNRTRVAFYRSIWSFFSLNFITKLFILYFLISAGRFIFWATRILKIK